MIICDDKKCTGCAACFNVCPKGCIAMTFNERNELSPTIDADKCVNCGACQRVCPVNKLVEKIPSAKCYACYAPEERDSSSSGGIAAELAKLFISKGDCVCGAVYENGTVHHKIVESEEELPKLKGSKYVQSYIDDIYKQIKVKLKDKNVLFVGTPCQVAGLRNFVGRSDRLYCVDLICHGGTSHRYLDAILPKKDGELSFRKNGDIAVRLDDDVVKYSGESIAAFLKMMSYRECCYSCRYADTERVGDITLGDFWGIKDFPETEKGVSIALVNTEKGTAMFDAIKSGLYCEERQLNEALGGNPQLSRPSIPHKHRDLFMKTVNRKGFVKAVHKSMKKEMVKLTIKKIVFSSKLLTKLYGALR